MIVGVSRRTDIPGILPGLVFRRLEERLRLCEKALSPRRVSELRLDRIRWTVCVLDKRIGAMMDRLSRLG